MSIFCSLYGQEVSRYDRVKQDNNSYTNAEIKAKFPGLTDKIIDKARIEANKGSLFMSGWNTADTFRKYSRKRDVSNEKRRQKKRTAIILPMHTTDVSEEEKERAHKKMKISYLLN